MLSDDAERTGADTGHGFRLHEGNRSFGVKRRDLVRELEHLAAN